MDLSDLSLFGKSVTEMTDEELLALVGETRNNRIEQVNLRRAKRQAKETKPKKKKVSKKVLSFAEVLERVDQMSPEQAASVLARLQSGGKITEADLQGDSGEDEQQEDDEITIDE